MKTAISIPDKIFSSAEKLAVEIGLSRSELYSRAVEKYVNEHFNADVTKRLNKVYHKKTSKLDPSIQEAQASSIPEEKW